MKINQRGFNVRMTQQFFNGHDIHAKFKQMGGIAVTQGMERNPFLQDYISLQLHVKPIASLVTLRGEPGSLPLKR